MPSAFDLVITTDYPNRTADLRLFDASGNPLAFRRTDFRSITVSRQQGLFDLRNYLWYLIDPARQAAGAAEIGVCIAEEVLGESIFLSLWEPESQRTLRIQLPGATREEDLLTAALARVPWEIARPSPGHPTLGERNLLVRVVHDAEQSRSQPLGLGENEDLRVLFVFAEAPGSRPLAARMERRALHRLLAGEIYPRRRVVADFLTHGVTRERLEEQIASRGGYHVVHWSGHGNLDLLELAGAEGTTDHLSGNELLDLFVRAGGFIPRLVYLSACHSGEILRVKDWSDFLAVAQGREPGPRGRSARGPGAVALEERPGFTGMERDARDIALKERPGFTGTAHALLQRGVPTVVAMRYEVGDDYARELAVEFYEALLAHDQPKSAAAALTMARRSLLDPHQHELARYDAWDHANPVLYGEEQPGLAPRAGRSPALDTRSPRLHTPAAGTAELTPAGHEHFVGRTWELAGLGADFIGSRTGAQVRPVALITGLGGMGKTALAAEALALWESRFQWVLLYQAKPGALGFEATLRDIHLQLFGELGLYHAHVEKYRADAIWRPEDAEFAGPERLDRLARNLVRALRDEAILLVLDNFETNLKPHPEPAESRNDTGEALWACQDPAWDRCLALLAAELRGTPSRVLVTCRRPLAALADGACHWVRLGPLPPGEAALYLGEHPGLSAMVFGGDTGEKELAMRLLNASRFHPLLMDRLARLATGGAALRPQLMQALDELESSEGAGELPALFATETRDAKELAYLEDALAASLDRLIADATPDARRLLWTIAIANEPVDLALLESVWTAEGYEPRQFRRIEAIRGDPSLLPDMLRVQSIPPEWRTRRNAPAPALRARPDPAPLLGYLRAVGLVTERAGPDGHNSELAAHELVRERVRAWMRDHEEDRGDLTEKSIQLAYADSLVRIFWELQRGNMAAAVQPGSRALMYCVQARDYDRLSGFAPTLVTGIFDPQALSGVLPYLEAAAGSAPAGRPRWSSLTCLAEALRYAGYPDASLPFYERGALLARRAAERPGEDERSPWVDLAWITEGWAAALFKTGNLDASRQRHLESAEAAKRADMAVILVMGQELEALRIDIVKGRVAEAMPQVEQRLAQLEEWWRKYQDGTSSLPIDEGGGLAQVFINALDIAEQGDFAKEDWESALRHSEAGLEVKRKLGRPEHEIAAERMNRANVLKNLGRLGEAKTELEACLEVFRDHPVFRASTLSSLASLFEVQGDIPQAIAQERRALALREQLPDPYDRALSHAGMARYLERAPIKEVRDTSNRHELAALVYEIVSGLTRSLQISLHNYTVDFQFANILGISPTIPRVAELVADPEFQPLDAWLRERQVDRVALQATIDELMEEARQAALEADARKAPHVPPRTKSLLQKGIAALREALGG